MKHLIHATLIFGDTVNGVFVEGHISEPKDNLGSWTVQLRKNDKLVGNIYGETREECLSMAQGFVNIVNLTKALQGVKNLESLIRYPEPPDTNSQHFDEGRAIHVMLKQVEEALEQTKI